MQPPACTHHGTQLSPEVAVSHAPIAFSSPTIVVLPWDDPVVAAVGHDPRSPYVEQFWLGVLGPSTTLLMRRFASAFDAFPDGFELDLADTARSLGLASAGGKHNAFTRAIERCVQFGLAHPHTHGLTVRRRIPPLSHRQVLRLPDALQEAHASWVASGDDAAHATHARRLARALRDAGLTPDEVERHLHLTGVAPRVAAGAVQDVAA
jgi:hypothetical protein